VRCGLIVGELYRQWPGLVSLEAETCRNGRMSVIMRDRQSFDKLKVLMMEVMVRWTKVARLVIVYDE